MPRRMAFRRTLEPRSRSSIAPRAARSRSIGTTDAAGVMGVAVFAERAPPIAQGDLRRKDAARDEAPTAQAPASPAAAARNQASGSAAREQQSRLGTGYGRSENSYASYTQFERAT